MIVIIGVVVAVVIATYFYMSQDLFGKKPEGERLERMSKSSHFKDGVFENFHHTPTLTEGYSMMGVMYKQIFGKHPRTQPKDSIPSVVTDLKSFAPDENVLVWFGHSSYFIQLNGRKILVDPVFSGNASPIPSSVNAFPGANGYGVEDMPDIDYLFISHDHYDHLDYQTIVAMKDKVRKVMCGLGVGSHFELWGYTQDQIIEGDWYDAVDLDDGFKAYFTPSRHFSGRGFKRNNTLWSSYVLEAEGFKLYIGGDSGYDTHFADIGNKFGPFDLAILENGQYNKAWEAIHMLPEQTLKAGSDLKAKRVFPVHSSKFKLAWHPWDEPLSEVSRLSADYNFPLVTPKIGEVVRLKDTTQTFDHWWEGME
ncbi:MBL fold metallo-hydrolase [Fulvivirga sediminis]|uniref:MBL fold metallo-hydrolase n=1 Tax=Fulvivirga sediminis TaxID=2803949 RepID=A0A937F600_9BACT|nr:MBL fold metallo-hydrolase [Fulvivirga sediminis]MBL3656375.1 MBL fold metallo-hydrolase [Fulvivirga sediminis]